ncbi:MAG: 30S ribosomal protein S6 [Proteobacteria bacterium]|nr:30S ribosomal protein S6 [Pseudomonadota bacterium]
MPLYESVFIVRQDVSDQHVEGLAERYSEMITENGGEVAKSEYWGLKNLAYRVSKNRKGHYMMFNIKGPSGAIDEFERNMRLSEDVLRYMTIRVDEFEEGPSAMMRNRGGRDEGRRDDRHRDRDRRPDRPAERENTEKSATSATTTAEPVVAAAAAAGDDEGTGS